MKPSSAVLILSVGFFLSGCARDPEERRQPGAGLPLTGVTIPEDSGAPKVSTSTAGSVLSEGAAASPALSPAKSPKVSLSLSNVLKSKKTKKLAQSAILAEINRVRTNPSAYAARLAKLKRTGRLPNGMLVAPEEGWRAVQEAINVLKRTRPLSRLAPSATLTESARAHVADLGPLGRTGHTSSNGENVFRRIKRFTPRANAMGENIFSGRLNAEEIVIMWIVDDGIYDRSHRDIVLSRWYESAGTACGPHARYGQMCVADFASE
jgi:hypothetical protein